VSLRIRMALASGVAVALAVIAVAFSAYAGTSSELQSQKDQSLRSLSSGVLGRAGIGPGGRPARSGPGPGPGRAPTEGSGLGFTSSAQFQRADPDDHDEGLGLDDPQAPAFGGAPGTLTLVEANGSTYVPKAQGYKIPVTAWAKRIAARRTGQYYTDMTVKGTEIRVLATGIGWRGALLVALPLTDVNHALRDQLLLLMLIAAAGVLLAALLGLLVARTALSPIARFTRQTETIALNPERLEEQRLDVHGGDELARLAQTFNRTLDALERSVQAQRNLVADASHELRTPISTIRANLQLMRDERLLTPEDRQALRADVIEELDELTALVGDVVELARGTKQGGDLGDLRLDHIAASAVERTRRRKPGLDVEVTLEPTLVHGEGDRIARAVTNLLDNAAKWSAPDGTVEVSLSDGVLAIRDHGPGFHEEDLPFVFDRFHRARDARSKPGSGLGLAIVRQAAEAHGGFVTAENAGGGGALLRIGFGPTLELAEDDPAEQEQAVSPS
jgi:two-component system, OmpR family, sensor histidine kinase MprB